MEEAHELPGLRGAELQSRRKSTFTSPYCDGMVSSSPARRRSSVLQAQISASALAPPDRLFEVRSGLPERRAGGLTPLQAAPSVRILLSSPATTIPRS